MVLAVQPGGGVQATLMQGAGTTLDAMSGIAVAARVTGAVISTAMTSSPISTNSSALRMSSSNSQNRSTWCRVLSDMANERPWLPMMTPATTIASGPDTCSACESS